MSWLARFDGTWLGGWLGRLASGGAIVEAAATLRGVSSLTAAGTVEAARPVVEAAAELPGVGVLEALAEVLEGIVSPGEGGGWVGPVSWPIRVPGGLVLAGATLSGYGDLTATAQVRPGKAKQVRQLMAALTAWRRGD